MEQESTHGTSTIVGVFDDTFQAEQAIAELTRRGYSEDQVDFVISEASTVTGSYAAGGEPVLRSHESDEAVIRVRAEGREQEVVELLNRHGAFDVRAMEEAADQGPGTIDQYTPSRITQTNTYNVKMEGSGEVETGKAGGIPRVQPGDETWDDVSHGYREHWQRRYGTAGRRWEDYEPAYRYGWERSQMPEYRGRSWSEMEHEFRSDWEHRHQLSPWDRIVEAVKDAWENVVGGHDRMDKAA